MANLSKLYAVLLMISNEYQNSIIAIKYFKKAITHFQSCGLEKGVAICQLGISKICHDRMNELIQENENITEKELINETIKLVSCAKETFDKLNDENASYQCLMIQKSLFPRSDVGDPDIKHIEMDGYSALMDENNEIMLGRLIHPWPFL